MENPFFNDILIFWILMGVDGLVALSEVNYGKRAQSLVFSIFLLEVAKLELVSGNGEGRVSGTELGENSPMARRCQERPAAFALGRRTQGVSGFYRAVGADRF